MSTPNEGTVGWRFSPKDEELINYFLRRKINGKDEDVKIIREIDVCKWEPWDLPGQSVLKSDDNEWFFFCPRDQKFPSSSRLNRATGKGYWKPTGKDRTIKSKNKKSDIGMKKTLVFHTGRASEGKRTYWVMHEYRTTLKELDGTLPGQTPYVLCRLFKKDDDSILDTTEIDVEVALLSPIPGELSAMELKPEPVSHQVGSLSEQDYEKTLVDSENCIGESSKATGQELQQDMNLEYLNWFHDPNPNDLSLLESPMVESMGSSLPAHSATDNFCLNGDFQLDGINSEQDDFTSNVLQSILTDSLDYCGNQDSNWISDFDIEVSRYAFVNQFEVPGTDNGVFLQSDSQNTDMYPQSQLDAELEPYASNAESSSPIPVTNSTWTSFQELDNSQNHHEYRGGAFVDGSSNNKNPGSNDHATQTGIQIRQRQHQLQTRPDNSNFNNHGTAQRRIRLQTNLGTSLITTEAESEAEVTSEFSKPKHTKQTITKKFITSLSDLTISHKFFLGLASISLTMLSSTPALAMSPPWRGKTHILYLITCAQFRYFFGM